MKRLLNSESKLTDRYQTTIPESVRKALNLGKQDKIRFTIQKDGKVLLSRVDMPHSDPALENFLALLGHDIANNPENVQAIKPKQVEDARSLVENVKIDLDAPLSDKDE